MKGETYNGWPNYETWNVMLWMDNEEGAYNLYRELAAKKAARKHYFSGHSARWCCEQAFGSETPDGVSFNNSRVRWGKVAEAMRER